MSHEDRKGLIEKSNPCITIMRQAELIGVSRANIYYKPTINEKEKQIMDWIDALYTEFPYYGARRIKQAVWRNHKIQLCRRRVRRLMQQMGLHPIYPEPQTSKGNKAHAVYPYLLRGVAASYPNHIWGSDITYIRLQEGWAYLFAIMDWFSRYVISWRLSNTLDTAFCVDGLSEAIEQAHADIHNSDQGSQFTNKEYIQLLSEGGIKISMDGRGKCMDNIFTERLWRSVKYEDVYIKSYATITEARKGLGEYFHQYNHQRLHQSLQYRTPAEVYLNP